MSERTRVRGIRFSDSDWERITERARAAQMSIQDYVRWQLLERPGAAPASAPTALPDTVQGRVAKAVMVLFELERRRVSATDEALVWEAIAAEVGAWLEREERLG